MSSSLNSTNLKPNSSAILKKTTTKKAGIYRYTTRERRDIRKIRHSGPGCSGVWILRVFWLPIKYPCPYNKTVYQHGKCFIFLTVAIDISMTVAHL